MSQILCRRYLRNQFHMFMQEQQISLKYQIQEYRSKLIHFLSDERADGLVGDSKGDRGNKRRLELKKFRLLGQMQVVKQILTGLLQPDGSDPDFLSKDHMFELIYQHLDKLMKAQVEHAFVLKFLNLK